MSPTTFRIETLGCKANQYDSQRLAEALVALGLSEATQDGPPGVIIINSCTVTHVADRKARQLANRAVREFPRARIFLTGCYATASPDAASKIEGIAGAFARGQWNEMLSAIAGGALSREARIEGEFGITRFTGPARALVKIQEGCDFLCAYCIVPHVRGSSQSRPLDEVVCEARSLAAQGFREIVLTGIHLGLYGRDLNAGVGLADAVEQVAQVPGVERLRLSSIEAPEVTARLLDAMQHRAVCPHLHMPLQSGSDGVLARMGRRYTAREFLDCAALARKRLDRPAITTDVMVGFPGESAEEFEETLRVCREARFSRMHVFPFSPRPGTRAAAMPGRVPAKVVKGRCAQLEELASKVAAEWAASFVGQCERVLFEEQDADGRLWGYTDRYVRIAVKDGTQLMRSVAHIKCLSAQGPTLCGRMIG